MRSGTAAGDPAARVYRVHRLNDQISLCSWKRAPLVVITSEVILMDGSHGLSTGVSESPDTPSLRERQTDIWFRSNGNKNLGNGGGNSLETIVDLN